MPSSFEARKARDHVMKLAQQGFRGYPIVTVAFYGPDDQVATKVVVSLLRESANHIDSMERWSSRDGQDLRALDDTYQHIDEMIRNWGARSVVAPEKILGCPHEEGLDYPEGQHCPECPFWKNRDRWSGVNA